MRTKILKWFALTALVLAATLPSTTGYYVLLGLGACVVAIWTVHAHRTGKDLRVATHTTAFPMVKFEN